MVDDRWSLRGVPADVQRAVAEAARREGRTVGRLVTDALQAALAGHTGNASATAYDGDLGATIARLTERLATVEARLAEMSSCRTNGGQVEEIDCRTDGRQSADGQSSQEPGRMTEDAQPSSPPCQPASRGALPDSGDHSGLAESVKAAREAKGWSQRQLAQASGVPQSEICKVERGALRNTPRSAEHVAKIRAALGTEV